MNYIKKLIDGEEDSLKKLVNIFRYQDDLISFNGGLLGNILNDIYHVKMIIVLIFLHSNVTI